MGRVPRTAKALAPDSQARAVCTDGWEATRQAWRGLFQIQLVLCFLHAILQMKKPCAGPLRHQGLDKAWQVYQAATTRQSRSACGAWPGGPGAPQWTGGPRVLQRGRRRADFTPADACPQAHRTSHAVDRLLDSQDRRLYAMRYWHGTTDSARLAVRAMALQWHFHPYGVRLRRDQPSRVSPFTT